MMLKMFLRIFFQEARVSVRLWFWALFVGIPCGLLAVWLVPDLPMDKALAVIVICLIVTSLGHRFGLNRALLDHGATTPKPSNVAFKHGPTRERYGKF